MLPPLQELERHVARLLREWRVPPGPKVPVRWNARLRTTAGRAFVHEGRIELNPALALAAPTALPSILVHEAAHIATRRLYGPRAPAHGRHWRALMALAGQPPEVTHELPIGRQRRRHYLYLRVCDGCGDRRVGRSVRYGVCRCGARNRYLVLRTPAGAGGLALLRAMPLSEVRRRCIMPGPA